MRRLETALRNVVQDLHELGREFALLGGFAADAESVVFALSQRGYSVTTTIEHKRTGRLATARTKSPSGAVVDFLFASSGRGYGRERPLQKELAEALVELGPDPER